MKQVKTLILILVGGLGIVSCNKQISERQTNPNKPAAVPPNLVLGTVLTAMSGTTTPGALSGTGSGEGINSWDGAHRWNQYHCSNYDYYDNNIYSWTNGNFDPYLILTDVVQMENEAVSRGGNKVNPYEAIGRFVRAYYFYNMTSMFGDIPLTEALQSPKIFTPKYSSQETVFKYVLDELDSANSDFASLISSLDNTLSTTQDIYYAGDLTKWQKLVNSFKIRVLVALSNKAGDALLNVPAQFATILGNPGKYPLFGSQDDDLAFRYNPGGNNTFSTYPFNPSNFGSIAGRFNMAKTYVDACTGLNDARVFITCDPAWALVGNDTLNPAQYKYFAGASTGESVATMYNNANNNLYSFIGRKRYYSNFTGEPDVLVGYKELCFNIAEGIVRGWAPGGTAAAETWYKKGITESFAFYGLDVTKTSFTAYFLPPGKSSINQVAPYTFNFDFNAYYAQPTVTLSTTAATAVNQIVLQKYIASFENSGYESYYNWRRTGTPTFLGGSGVGNNGVIPVRWAYPVSEQSVNAANWQTALTNQGFTADDLNQKMWLLK
ncbi:MAG TPA: SusD/RagB family nutrient-binding outer membrane lipoprotein [Puia sp.]|uniref:SusD/RagB family nutrient-binding outer membrane lipoprotein n=1 Tax=Puia sp. TaxID=2045100 RepID=UPI002BF6B329|nr:SusD/RagB family nutrient-binding outer membrane lipoprotein [Puia sp.]HVU99085.1 SusD/RagB family nutrient-binding outer membrane lipoprotein [Puia sp.]